MRKWNGFVVGIVLVALAMVPLAGIVAAQDDGGQVRVPKHTIKVVMENAHKAGLLKKVLAGDASQAEKLALLDHYVSLAESEPPEGDLEDWQAKTNAIVVAAAKVVVDRSDGMTLLKEVTNCAACHRDHKPAE